jgi:hypothetical protein
MHHALIVSCHYAGKLDTAVQGPAVNDCDTRLAMAGIASTRIENAILAINGSCYTCVKLTDETDMK